MVSGVRCRVSAIRGQRSDDRRQMKKMQDEPTFLSSVIRLLTPDTRHPPDSPCVSHGGRGLKPVLLTKKIDYNDLYFANYLRDATLATTYSVR